MPALIPVKHIHIFKLVIGVVALLVGTFAFLLRLSIWNARTTPGTRAALMPEAEHIKGLFFFGFVILVAFLLIAHSLYSLSTKKEPPISSSHEIK
jgi:hypothetical protein